MYVTVAPIETQQITSTNHNAPRGFCATRLVMPCSILATKESWLADPSAMTIPGVRSSSRAIARKVM